VMRKWAGYMHAVARIHLGLLRGQAARGRP